MKRSTQNSMKHVSVNVGLDTSVCNNKQRWNDDKCRYESEELVEFIKDVCDKGFTWNPSNCECEWDKSCDVDEYLDYESCKCWKELVSSIVDECTENVGVDDNVGCVKSMCKCSCLVYIVLMVVVLTICVGIGSYFV